MRGFSFVYALSEVMLRGLSYTTLNENGGVAERLIEYAKTDLDLCHKRGKGGSLGTGEGGDLWCTAIAPVSSFCFRLLPHCESPSSATSESSPKNQHRQSHLAFHSTVRRYGLELTEQYADQAAPPSRFREAIASSTCATRGPQHSIGVGAEPEGLLALNHRATVIAGDPRPVQLPLI